MTNRSYRLPVSFQHFNALVLVREGLGEDSVGVPDAFPILFCIALDLHIYFKLGSHCDVMIARKVQ